MVNYIAMLQREETTFFFIIEKCLPTYEIMKFVFKMSHTLVPFPNCAIFLFTWSCFKT